MKTCNQEYQDAIKQRLNHPLKNGEYKLNEALTHLNAREEEIRILADCQKHKQPLRGILTYEDHGPWLKNMPLDIANLLGYFILPSIKALKADGVPEHILHKQLPWFESEIKRLVQKCEISHRLLKSGVQYEYNCWKYDDSVLLPIIEDTKTLIEIAKRMIP